MRKQTATVCGVLLGAGLAKRFCSEKLLHPFVGRPLFSWPLQEAIHSKWQKYIRSDVRRFCGICHPLHECEVCAIRDRILGNPIR